jgi:hypothetical protein
MARRYRGDMNGERYLANTSPSKREVHLGGHPKPATDGHLKTGHHDT